MLAQSPEEIDAYLATGNSHSVAAGRLSFLLGVNGPSLAVDTACSSSLVAVHLACQSLRQQECNLALVGGVNRILTPTASINFSKARMLSADGRCRTFDQAASGFGRAEGGGMVVLKRLSDAQAAGDRIQAVILGSATNHNGRTNGLTAPSKLAQTAVIQQALIASRLTPADVDYVETHGTGTALGDPIEVAALGQVFASKRTDSVVLGALKTNIGHTEAAAGMAGLIKAVLAIEHEQIPANLHLDRPNPLIEWDTLPFYLPSEVTPWPKSASPPTVGVSAFGFSGTNAHLIVQSLSRFLSAHHSSAHEDRYIEQPAAASNSPICLLPLSARSPAALNQLAARYARHLAVHSTIELVDLCFTASVGRSHFPYRLAVVADSILALRQILIDALSGRPHPNCYRNDTFDSVNYKSGHLAQPIISDSRSISLSVVSSAAASVAASLPTVAKSYVAGETIDWASLYQGRHTKLALPTYPFQREYYGPHMT